jgi:hypothetical protein
VVYTDDTMMEDAHHVTKCYFSELDKAELGEALSAFVHQILEEEIGRRRDRDLLRTMPVYFSDEDRASEGKDFSAFELGGS